MKVSALTLTVAAMFASSVTAGPLAYAACQAGCATVVMACYTAGGATWGATLGATAPATIIGCNSAYASCQAVCASVALFALTP
ncbi:hypothetical protein FPQ18DRAFT_251069 [Pyronema domesticum]|nr:hypothetical protein FPQ18DRAFT_251069 [Pyronema domesticum]